MQQSARFISIEGSEGAGKSLFIQGLSQALQIRKISHILSREPGGSQVGDQIRQLFKHPPAGEALVPMAELLLVSAARSQHVNVTIKPALARDLWVLCDRYYDSTRVYQGFLAGVERMKLETIVDYSVDGCHPHLTFVLDCPAEVAMQRVAARTRAAGPSRDPVNRYDNGSLELYQKLRKGYLDLAQQYPERLKVLDATQKPENLLKDAVRVLQNYWSI